MTGTDAAQILPFPEPSFHAGPPPPSPPASVDNIADDDNDDDQSNNLRAHAPRLTMPSQSEPPMIYDEPESIVGVKALHRASTDTRASFPTARLPSSQPPPPQPLPAPMPIPEPASRQDGFFSQHITTIVTTKATTVTGSGPTAAATGGVGAPVPIQAAPPSPRRHTTGSPSPKHQRHYQSFAPPQPSHSHHHHLHTPVHLHAPHRPNFTQDDTAILGDVTQDLQSDIDIQTEQVRRERQSKRAKAQAQAQAEAEAAAAAALTRTDTRGTRGTKGDDQDDSKPLVGNLIGEDHVNYVLMYNMLTGIRTGVSRCQAKIKKTLTDEDFTAKHKYSFDIVGNELTPSAKYDFKFKDYAPWVFRTLREDVFRLDPADYLLSLTAKYILSELGSPGKSGSFFYFSRDYRFIIKTIRHSEHQFLLSTLRQYYEHVKHNPHTLLSRFYGLHRVKLPRGKKIHFVIMNNLFPPHKDIHETYDLKGSTIGREYPESKAAKNPRAVLKDLNWINRRKELELGPEKRALLAEQLRRDVEYLKSVDVMDYSLLVGVHSMRRGNRENVRRNTLRVFEPELPQGVQRTKQMRGTRTPEAIAMRRAMRSSDPKALSSATNVTATAATTATTTNPASTGAQVPGGTLHPPMTTPMFTNTNTLTGSPSSSPNLLNVNAGASSSSVMLPPQNVITSNANANAHNGHNILTATDVHSPQFAQHGHIVAPTADEEPGLFLDENTTSDRQHFIFYQDEGGLQATDEENLPLANDHSATRGGGTIYYLGVIDILTPYGFAKRAEHYWKCCTLLAGAGAGGGGEGGGAGAGRSYGDRKKKISQVNPKEYGDRFVAFMKAIMRGGEGGTRFK